MKRVSIYIADMKHTLACLILLLFLITPAWSGDFACDIPDATFNQSFAEVRKNIKTWADRGTFGHGEDGAFAANALAKIGDATAAWKLLANNEPFASGYHPSLVWALVNHYRITSNTAALDKALSLVRKESAGLIDGATNMDLALWNIAAYQSALYASQVRADVAAVKALTKEYCDRSEGFFAQLARLRSDEGIQYIPGVIGEASAPVYRRFSLNGLWPTAVLDPLEPVTITAYEEAYAAIQSATTKWLVSPEDRIRLAHNLLLLGQRERALSLARDAAHFYTSSSPAPYIEWLFLCRDRLLYEDRDTLVLLSGAPMNWYADGNTIKVTAAPTGFGPISFQVMSATDTIILEFIPSSRITKDCSLVEWPLPGEMKIRAVRIDGRRVYEYRHNAVRMMPRRCMVTVEYGK